MYTLMCDVGFSGKTRHVAKAVAMFASGSSSALAAAPFFQNH
jgi:hypothetical protein